MELSQIPYKKIVLYESHKRATIILQLKFLASLHVKSANSSEEHSANAP